MVISTEKIVMELRKNKNTIASEALELEQLKQSSDISRLISALQTTINLDELLPIFHRELLKVVNHSGFIFDHNELNISEQYGQRTNHKCEYDLSVESTSLGKLTFMRRKRFSEDELQAIERFVGALLYPLKNTLLYLQAIQLAHTDPLTGVLNRSTLQSVFQKETSLTKRHHSDLTLITLDIDFFKAVNDNFGHSAGDLALQEVTKCIQHTVRESDHVFRTGGEEFVILLNATNLKGAELLAERLRIAVQSISINYAEAQFDVTVSMGVTACRENESLENIIDRSDKALYEAKHTGRNKVVSA